MNLNVYRHSGFRHAVLKAVPREWYPQKEQRGHYVDPKAIWRADVLAWKDTCVVALEAQRGDWLTVQRSDRYLAAGVWPLWFFWRIPSKLQTDAVLSVADLEAIPDLLSGIFQLPDPIGRTWTDVQGDLHAVIAAAGGRRPNPTVCAKRMSFSKLYQRGYAQGRADVLAEMQKTSDAMKGA